MAKLNWNKASGRGYGFSGGIYYHYGKSSGARRCFWGLRVTGITAIQTKSGHKACVIGAKKSDDTEYVFVAYGHFSEAVYHKLKVGHNLCCVARPTGNRWMEIRYIRLVGFGH